MAEQWQIAIGQLRNGKNGPKHIFGFGPFQATCDLKARESEMITKHEGRHLKNMKVATLKARVSPASHDVVLPSWH